MVAHLQLPDGRRVPLTDGLVIGRVAGCDVVLDDAKASRRHARIVLQGGVAEIEDLGSSNGTQLNGKPVTRRLLRSGDEVQIGTTVLRVVEGPSGPAAAAAAAPAAVDDVDLFGDEVEPAPTSAPPPAAPRPAPAPPAAVPTPPASPSPPSPPSPPAPARVVEFEDEVVAVRKPAAAATPAQAAAGEPVVQSRQRVLQYHKQDDRGGVLGDDLGQMGTPARLLVYVLVLAGAVGLFWLAMSVAG